MEKRYTRKNCVQKKIKGEEKGFGLYSQKKNLMVLRWVFGNKKQVIEVISVGNFTTNNLQNYKLYLQE